MTNYLKHKPGSIEEITAKMKPEDSDYQAKFKKELEKAGKGIGSMSPKEKKDFFNKIDKMHKGKNEAKVDELTSAQKKLPPALQKAIKAKEKNEDLDSKDEPSVKDVANQLKKAVKAHGQQAKDLEKAIKTENVNQVQVRRDGENFNLMFRGKEIGYYHKEGGKYLVYYDKDGDDYDQSDEVSTEMQAKKLAYDNINEADAKGDDINQGKMDRVKKGEKDLVDPKPSLKSVAKTVKEMMRKKKDYVATMADTEKEKEAKKTTLVGSKKTPIDLKPEVEYKN